MTDEIITSCPRSYQLEILDSVLRENTLAFLPTGSGKTLIAVLLIKHRLVGIRERGIRGEKKQLIVFLAPTKILVGQQHRYISGNCDAEVRSYTGDTMTRDNTLMDNWSADDWLREYVEAEILCMTPEILRNILERKLLTLDVFDCVILDECHHAFGKNPMAGVCRLMNDSPLGMRPRVLGLTASPLPCKKGSVTDKIAELERITGCKLVAPRHSIADLQRHVPRPEFHFLTHCRVPGSRVYGRLEDFASSPNGILVGMSSILDCDHKEVFLPNVNPANQPAFCLYHCFLRARHGLYVDELCTLMTTMCLDNISSLVQFEGADVIVTAGMQLRATARQKSRENGSSLKLADMPPLVGQIARVCEDCGAVAGMHALLVSFSSHADIQTSCHGLSSGGDTSVSSVAESSREVVRSVLAYSKRRTDTCDERDACSIDLGRYQGLAMELVESPFLQNTQCDSPSGIAVAHDASYLACCDAQDVKKCTLIDMFTALVASMGGDRCRRCVLLASEVFEHKWIATSWIPVVLGIMESIGRGNSLSYATGSRGVLACADICSRCPPEGTIETLVDAVCWGCRLMLSTFTAEDLTGLLLRAEGGTVHYRLSPEEWTLTADLAPPAKRYQPCVLTTHPASSVKGLCGDGVDVTIVPPLRTHFSLLSPKVAICFRDVLSQMGSCWKEVVSLKAPGFGPDVSSGTSDDSNSASEESDVSENESELQEDNQDCWACIVFCQTRLTVEALSRLMQQMISATKELILRVENRSGVNAIVTSRVRPCCIIGGFASHLQDRTLLEFKRGLYNVMFATDVAEEGLDVRACQRIVNFDAPNTVKSHVQRRGRARAKNSVMITIRSNGVDGKRLTQDTLLLLGQELEMEGYKGPTTLSKLHKESSQSTGNFEDDSDGPSDIESSIASLSITMVSGLEAGEGAYDCALPSKAVPIADLAYVVPTSGVRADMSNAVSVLNHYCSLLPQDKYSTPAALYWMETYRAYSFEEKHTTEPCESEVFRCAVLLPSSVPPNIRCVLGPPTTSKSHAKYAAALQCVRNLHMAGQLNDRLVSVHVKKKNRNVVGKGVIRPQPLDPATVAAYSTTPCIGLTGVYEEDDPEATIYIEVKISPDATNPQFLQLSDDLSTRRLYMYEFEAIVPDCSHRGILDRCPTCCRYVQAIEVFGLAFLRPLPPEILQEDMQFCLRGIKVTVRIRHVSTRDTSSDEIRNMQRFHRALLCWECRNQDQEVLEVSPFEWAQSAFHSWYIMFPAVPKSRHQASNERNQWYASVRHRSTEALIDHPDEWLIFLKRCADSAESLVRNFYHFSYMTGPEFVNYKRASDQHMASEDSTPTRCKDLQDQIFCRSDHRLYISAFPTGLETEKKVLLTDKFTISSGESISYLEYYTLGNKLSTHDIEQLERDGNCLMASASLSGRLSLVQLCDSETLFADIVNLEHTHTKVLQLVPSHCVLLGRVDWMMAGMVAPSLLWRVQSLLLAIEARDKIYKLLPNKTPIADTFESLFLRHTTLSEYTESRESSHVQRENQCVLPSPSLMLRAITPTMTLEAINSERLEFLGDTVLKFATSWALYQLHPDKQEGFLTTERMKLVSNSYQATQAKVLDLAQYLRVYTLSKGKQELLFSPCGRSPCLEKARESKDYASAISLWNQDICKHAGSSHVEMNLSPENAKLKSERSGSRHAVAEVKSKKLADMLEAIIGAFYETDGIEAAIAVIKALKMWPQDFHTKTESLSTQMPVKSLSSQFRREGSLVIPLGYPLPLERIALGFRPQSYGAGEESSALTNEQRMQVALRPLCEAIGYYFSDISLLDQALTHCSVLHKPSNQRLEFLGDAVLDLGVMSVLYEASPVATQGTLSALKHRLLCNQHLAIVAIGLGLHKHMFVFSAVLVSQFGEIALWKEAHDRKDKAGERALEGGFGGGKVLADCLEALIAAVFIDSHCDMQTVRSVVDRIGVIPPEVMQDASSGYAASAVM